MTEEFNSETEVMLEIENTFLKCNKQELIQHSDYFKVMFEGNFIERNKKVVKLEGIALKAMNIILSLLWDRDNTLLIEKEEDLTSVLQVSCMLQFVEIKTICVDRLTHILSPRNCIKIWIFTEQLDLRLLYLKAKNMALMEFETVKDLENILELNLLQLHSYLANTSLQCKNELDVFQLCMKWWYENSDKISESMSDEHSESFRTETFLRLLSCLDFNSISNSDIQEIMMYPDVSQSSEIMDILRCIINMRDGIVVSCEEHVVNKAKILSNSKSRSYKQLPCIMVHGISDEPKCKKQKTANEKHSVVYYDMFKRKRYYMSLTLPASPITIAYYDKRKNNFAKLLNIEKQKCGKLEGFQVVCYKEFIFLFGGEFVLGHGNWNKNFWVYDMIRESWERKSLMPFVRRHFESCVCGHYLYIIGGTGNFRVIQDNLFWYNYKEDKWSQQIKLPCFGRQIKCCCWNDQLLIVDINEKCGFLFNQYKSSWHKINICDNKQVISSGDYAMFPYKNSIYLKGDSLIEMVVEDQELVVVKHKPLEFEEYVEIESIVCGDIIYTLYLQNLNCNNVLSLEKYDISSDTSEFIFKEAPQGTVVDIENNQYVLGPETTLFGFQYHELVASNDFVNNL